MQEHDATLYEVLFQKRGNVTYYDEIWKAATSITNEQNIAVIVQDVLDASSIETML